MDTLHIAILIASDRKKTGQAARDAEDFEVIGRRTNPLVAY